MGLRPLTTPSGIYGPLQFDFTLLRLSRQQNTARAMLIVEFRGQQKQHLSGGLFLQRRFFRRSRLQCWHNTSDVSKGNFGTAASRHKQTPDCPHWADSSIGQRRAFCRGKPELYSCIAKGSALARAKVMRERHPTLSPGLPRGAEGRTFPTDDIRSCRQGDPNRPPLPLRP